MAAGYVDARSERGRSGSRQDDRRDSRDYGQRSDGYLMSTHGSILETVLGLQVQRFVGQQQVSLKWITQGLLNLGR